MSAGRTVWRAKDCEWSNRERVVELGEEFGPAGPMVLDWLEEQAKKQNDGGRMRSGFRALARGAFLRGGVEEAERIVRYAVEIGAVDDFEVEATRLFRCRVSGWQADQSMGRAAFRKTSQREREDAPDDSGTARTLSRSVTHSHALSRPVTQGAGEGDGEGVASSSLVEESDVPTIGGANGLGSDTDVSAISSRSVTPRHALSRLSTRQDSTDIQLPPNPQTGAMRVKYEGRVVPTARSDLALRCLDEFNAQAGTKYAALTGAGKPSESLKRIIGALTHSDDPPFDQVAGAIRWRLANPFWEGAPHAGVVFGPRVFEQALASAGASTDGAMTPELRAKLVGR